MFPTQYATNTAEAMKLFFVSPATFAAPSVTVKPTTGPKNPMSEYPTTGATGRWPHSDFQMMLKPAMVGRQQASKSLMRIFLYFEQSQPVSGIPTAHTAPSGNWKRMLSRAEYPNVETMSGPKPETAPLTVYLTVTRQLIQRSGKQKEDPRRSHRQGHKPNLHIQRRLFDLRPFDFLVPDACLPSA